VNVDLNVDAAPVPPTLLSGVPREVRLRIFTGLRWALWLTLLSTPFSYGITVLLARTSPEALGTYGTLAVYLAAVNCFFYLGGDTVSIKFLPELPRERRAPFLLSYALVVALWFCVWLLALAIWPEHLRLLFGKVGDRNFYLLLIGLAPICLLLNLVVGALKGLLEIQLAHALLRLITVVQCLAYAVLFLAFPVLLATRYRALVWGLYLGLALLAALIGLVSLYARHRLGLSRADWSFWLPAGFWGFAFSAQAVSVVWFFLGQLDSLLIINFGDLADLGRYVAIMSVATVARVVTNLVIETVLPSITNALASGGRTAASEVFTMYWRLLLIANTAIGCVLVLFVGPISRLLGPEYVARQPLLVLATLLVVLACPGWIGGSLLSGAGEQHRSIWIGLGQLALFLALFAAWWPRWRLAGAVLAYGTSLLASHSALLLAARRNVPLDFSALHEYFKFAAVVTVSAAASALFPLPLPLAVALCIAAVLSFLAWARYRPAECLDLLRRLVPSR
jgi:O-antigen/teichoic acid export membrane protein